MGVLKSNGGGALSCPPARTDSTPHRESAENSQQAVILFFGIIKSSPSGIHSGAGSVIHLGGVVHFVRHLTDGSYLKFN